MKSKSEKNTSRAKTFLLLLAFAVSLMIDPGVLTAKSLYVIADIKGLTADALQPVQAYNIEADGTLTFQVEHNIRHRVLGAVGITIDTDNEFLFITYEASEEIQLLDARTMMGEGTVVAPDASNLAGVVYDHDKGLLYTVDRHTSRLYVYNWEPEAKTLTHAPGSPFTLRNATAYGIALNEISDLLYVANGTNKVTVYRTSDWRQVDTITLNRVAISVAVGVVRGFLYTGGGFAGNKYLTQYHLATGTLREVQVEPDAGVMGLGVDPATGYVYLTTGVNGEPGGDNLLAFDTNLKQIGMIPKIGNPTGLVVPGRDFGYDPLNLRKTLVRGGSGTINSEGTPFVGAGTTITYGILFDNFNDFIATDVLVSDQLPEEVIFVRADNDGVNGHYDPQTHTYEWFYPSLTPGTSTSLELTVEVNKEVEAGTIVTNSVTVSSNQTAPTTKRLDVVVETKAVENNPLNLTKRISGVAEGQTAWVDADESISYTICFDNNNNDSSVTNVSVVDYLPDEVKFIDLGKETPSGKYDATEHTYTWTFSSLAPGEPICLEVNGQIEKDVAPGTTITNSVIVDSDETPPSTASVEAITYQNPLNLTKHISGVSTGQVAWVDADESITYTICFDNNNNDSPVTNVSVVDYLPDEVKFIDLGKETPSGKYDATEHSYTWTFSSLPSGEAICLNMNVKVNKDVDSGTIITNTVIVDSDETPPSTASVEAITYQNPLNLTKRISGVTEDQIAWVDADKPITYTICFDNNDSDLPVTNISVVDYLPDEVQFVGLGADTPLGKYDASEHTYTWLFPFLAPGETICLEVNVQVNKDVNPGTTIVNTVIVDSDETPPSTGNAEAITYQNPLNLTKRILGTPVGQTALVSTDGPATYIIQFENNNDFTVTNIFVFDVLPKEVRLVSAEEEMISGKYDPETHTYTWWFPSLEPGKAVRLELNTHVDKDLAKGTIFTNSVTVESAETLPSTATADAIVDDSLLTVKNMKILPNIIRRTDHSYDIQASIVFPEGIGKKDISNVIPTLYPGTITAKQQFVYGTDTRVKVIALFDKAELLNAVPGYGQMTLKMVGALTSDHSYTGEATVYITKYTGR